MCVRADDTFVLPRHITNIDERRYRAGAQIHWQFRVFGQVGNRRSEVRLVVKARSNALDRTVESQRIIHVIR
jgi:hypothetical protein